MRQAGDAGGEAGGEVEVGATGRIGSGFASVQPASSTVAATAAATVAATEPLTPRTYLSKIVPGFGNIRRTE